MSDRYTNPAVEARVLTRSARRCCLCFYLMHDLNPKEGQIAHLDHDPTNSAEDNLAFLCLAHHSLYDSRTSQHKNYTIREVKEAREALHVKVASRPPDDTSVEEDDEPIEEVEETTLIQADEDKVYTFDMSEGQELVGAMSAHDIIDVLICDEKDYNDWCDSEENDEEDSLPDHYVFAEDIRHRKFTFVAPADNTYVLVLMNWRDDVVEVTIDWALWGCADDEE